MAMTAAGLVGEAKNDEVDLLEGILSTLASFCSDLTFALPDLIGVTAGSFEDEATGSTMMQSSESELSSDFAATFFFSSRLNCFVSSFASLLANSASDSVAFALARLVDAKKLAGIACFLLALLSEGEPAGRFGAIVCCSIEVGNEELSSKK